MNFKHICLSIIRINKLKPNQLVNIFFFLSGLFIFSQSIKNHEFSVSEIDSLSKIESCRSLYDFGGTIEVTETLNAWTQPKIIGNGREGWKVHTFLIDSIYYKLPEQEAKKYNIDNDCKLIRADYKMTIDYIDESSEIENIKLYFRNDSIYYIKYNYHTTNDKSNKRPKAFETEYINIKKELKNEPNLYNRIIDEIKVFIKYWFN